MFFDKIKQDANSIVEAGFNLNNLLADKKKAEASNDEAKIKEIKDKIIKLKMHIRKILESMNNYVMKQEAELNG